MLKRILSPPLVLMASMLGFAVLALEEGSPAVRGLQVLCGAVALVVIVMVPIQGRRNLKEAEHGITLIEQGRYAEALALHERAEDRWVRVPTVRYHRALALLGL